MNIKQKLAAAAVGVALLGGGAGMAVAMGGTSSAATSDTAAAAPAQAPAGGVRRPGGQLMRRVVHGDLTVKAKDGFDKVTYDRGTVTSKSGSSITLQRPDNVTVTVKVDGNTRYRGVDSLDQVETGKPAIVLSKDGTAVLVGQGNGAGRQGSAAPAAPAASGA